MDSKHEKQEEGEEKGQEAVKDSMSTAYKARHFRANSLEEIDQMTNLEVLSSRLSGASKIRLKRQMKDTRDYKDAKPTIIREKFISSRKCQNKQATTTNTGKERAANNGNSMAQKRTRSRSKLDTKTTYLHSVCPG